VNIVGFGGEMEQITLDSLDAYMKLKTLPSRTTFNSQSTARFARFSDRPNCNGCSKTAGATSPRDREALIASTGRRSISTLATTCLTAPIVSKNAPSHGFVRTVSRESWHWEYRPVEAKELAALGKFKLDGVENAA
jgi:hypothetical protein